MRPLLFFAGSRVKTVASVLQSSVWSRPIMRQKLRRPSTGEASCGGASKRRSPAVDCMVLRAQFDTEITFFS